MIDKRPGSGGGKDELVFVGLGGLGEIGMNLYLYGYGPPDARKWLMIDCGITFPEGEFDPGIDVILPDVRTELKKDAEARVRGAVALIRRRDQQFHAVLPR